LLSITPAITFASPNDRDLGIVRLRYATIVVRDYDEALNWYTNVLGFEKVEDEPWDVTAAMFEDLYGNVFVVENFRAIPGTSTP
jgi:catechol 2,3-dioxygenase-like lactoylglutathione lyase family enzyme